MIKVATGTIPNIAGLKDAINKKWNIDSVPYDSKIPQMYVQDVENNYVPVNNIPQNQRNVKPSRTVSELQKYLYGLLDRVSGHSKFKNIESAINRIENGDGKYKDIELFMPGNDAAREAFYKATDIKLPEDEFGTVSRLIEFDNREEFQLTSDGENAKIATERKLSASEYEYVKNRTGWSDAVISCISTFKEAFVYMEAKLKETIINDRTVLITDDIDLEQVNADGLTNRELIESGKSPYAKSGEKIELHHMGQKNDGVLVELTETQHSKNGNSKTLHNNKLKSEINRNDFKKVRRQHWKQRMYNLE